MTPDVMLRQAASLAEDHRRLLSELPPLIAQIFAEPRWRRINKVYLTGCGDSYHAALACEGAFERIAGIACEPMTALTFAGYGSRATACDPNAHLVVAASASGSTPATRRAVQQGLHAGAVTLGVSATPNSALAGVAERNLILNLANLEPSPAIRTYHATLIGMHLVALELAARHNRWSASDLESLRGELFSLADLIVATNEKLATTAGAVAETIADARTVVVLGSGPSHGTARYSAAKIIEASGVPAVAQDVEEWFHIERFAQPRDSPLVIFAPPGASHSRSVEVARTASSLGRRVIIVCRDGDRELSSPAWHHFGVPGDMHEEFTPLVYHLFAIHVASRIATRLGRRPFQS
jgi:glutamine---fructose-6-phosphate transaminase (isomerizing)